MREESKEDDGAAKGTGKGVGDALGFKPVPVPVHKTTSSRLLFIEFPLQYR